MYSYIYVKREAGQSAYIYDDFVIGGTDSQLTSAFIGAFRGITNTTDWSWCGCVIKRSFWLLCVDAYLIYVPDFQVRLPEMYQYPLLGILYASWICKHYLQKTLSTD
jgi:hypothetical protein